MNETQIQNTPQDLDNETDQSQFLIFTVSNNHFGIEISNIKEVIEIDQIYTIPLVSKTIPGVINLRGIIVPIIDLCTRLYGHAIGASVSSKIIIVELENNGEIIQMGITVDSVLSVVDIPQEKIENAPVFGSNIRSDFILNTTEINDNLIIMLNVQKILDIDELSEFETELADIKKFDSSEMISNEDILIEIQQDHNHEISEENDFIVFDIDNATYGISVKWLHEIIKLEKITSLPNSLPFMKGIVNLRGTAVPLVDLRFLFEIGETNHETSPWTLIVDINGVLIGLIIETLSDLIPIDVSKIQKTLHYSANINKDFISGIAEVAGKLIILLNIDKILTNEELEKIIGSRDGARQ